MSLRSKKSITLCRPIPAFIPRQLALDVLHDHSEVITLNPLVLSHRAIPAPIDAPPDEALSTWYEITERIQFIPGLGKAGSSTINFNGVFHNVPWGLQTHIYAPMNVDMRAQYRIAGSQAGVEAAAPRELGLEKLGAPREGLYLRADIEFKCNVALAGFVKSTSVAALGDMVNRMVQKAEKLDADVLQGMIREERDSNVTRTRSSEQQPQLAWQLREQESRRQSQSSVQQLTQTQSLPQRPPVNGQNSWSTKEQQQQLAHSRTEPVAHELSPPSMRQHSSYEQTQQPRQAEYAYQQQHPQRDYAAPTHAAELDNTDRSAGSEQSGWSASTWNSNTTNTNNSNNTSTGAYPYPDIRPHSSQGRSSSQQGNIYNTQQQQQQQHMPHNQPRAPSPQPPSQQSKPHPYSYTYNPEDYQPQPQQPQSNANQPRFQLPSQQQQGQGQNRYNYYQTQTPPQGQQYQTQQPQLQLQSQQQQQRSSSQQNEEPKTPQFSEARKYSFDADRLRPEALNVGGMGMMGMGQHQQRRWSGVGVGE